MGVGGLARVEVDKYSSEGFSRDQGQYEGTG
jgi:hypothetical protein